MVDEIDQYPQKSMLSGTSIEQNANSHSVRV